MKIQEALKAIEKDNQKGKKINAILQVDKKASFGKGKLNGKVVAVKANINVKGMNVNCASKTLENYKSPYDATVIRKIKQEGGAIIGITNMDEFACGSSNETSAFGACKNPANLEIIPGGSSGGSAASVAAGFCDLALGSDTGGSIRNPASNCGVIGVKPSYGLVSRYGLIDLSMSLDQIGVFGKNIEDVMLLLSVIAGKDEKDATSIGGKVGLEKLNKIKIGMPEIEADKRILKLINDKVSEISSKLKWKVEKTKIKNIDLAIQTYYPIVYAEFFSGTRKFDGRRYGKKIEESCGEEVLRRILGGQEIMQAEYHGKYYRKALSVKEFLKAEFEKAFSEYDCLITPVVPSLPWKLGQTKKMKPEEVYAYDSLTVLANLAEIPAISIPAGKIEGIPVGLQIMCKRFDDGKMMSVAREFLR